MEGDTGGSSEDVEMGEGGEWRGIGQDAIDIIPVDR